MGVVVGDIASGFCVNYNKLHYDKLIFDLDNPGACGVTLEETSGKPLRIGCNARTSIGLPSVSEPDVMRHYVMRSTQNYCIQTVMIHLLGSCTMKFNPPINEVIASNPGFSMVHPLQPAETAQGCLEITYELQEILKKLTGFDAISLVPAAGAHAEFVSLVMIRAHHKHTGNEHKNVVLIPSSAHGTNPASTSACGYDIVVVPSNAEGTVDMEALPALVNENVAALMITNPNTCGIFEPNIQAIADILHSKGAMLYCDGANFNAIVGKVSPALLGIDVMHLNLHKTFSTPHGGGGPGGGVICSVSKLAPYMPTPWVSKELDTYTLDNVGTGLSVGRIKGFHGHFAVHLRALSYILSLGSDIYKVAENATLNANYLLSKLSVHYHAPFGNRCMHECLLTDKNLNGITTNDIAKCLIDEGIHPMTVYFPLIVSGAMLIEPTETETKRTLDSLIEIMIKIANKAKSGDISYFINRPFTATVGKVDETLAARKPKLVA